MFAAYVREYHGLYPMPLDLAVVVVEPGRVEWCGVARLVGEDLDFVAVVSEHGLVEVYTSLPLRLTVYERPRWGKSRTSRDVAVVVDGDAFLVVGVDYGYVRRVVADYVEGWEPSSRWHATDAGVAIVETDALRWPRWLGALYTHDVLADDPPQELTTPASALGLGGVVARYVGAGRPGAETVVVFDRKMRVRDGHVVGLEDVEQSIADIITENEGSGIVSCHTSDEFWFLAPGAGAPVRLRLLEDGEVVETAEPGDVPLVCVAGIARLAYPDPWNPRE